MESHQHIIIIGGGVGGYTAALEACHKGWQVTLIEKDKWGGTCLQRGCVPMKFLLEQVHNRREKDLSAWQQEKEDLLLEQTYGLQYRLEKAQIHLIHGTGQVVKAADEVVVEVAADDGSKQTIAGDYLVLATGAHTAVPEIFRPYQSRLWDVTDVLEAKTLPESMVIVGAGVSGVECAEYLASLGVGVHLIERAEQILPGWDTDVAEAVMDYLEEEMDICCYTGCNVMRIDLIDQGYQLTLDAKAGAVTTVEGESILICTGKEGNISGMGLETLGILDESCQKIPVNAQQQTVNPRIYAVGDCTLQSMTAHGAAWEARQAVCHMTGGKTAPPHSVSAFLSLHPPACKAGMTKEEAEKKGLCVRTGTTPLYGNGKAAILQQTYGMIKIVADKTTGQILGFHMYGPFADELLSLGSFMIEQKSTVEQVKAMAFPHPTVGEYIQEAIEKL
ncbi:MAG: dihydrolipoyl dehydrogenase family protein [Lachnospiraceae bacterium]|jgi:dihydrolipoamide dehydrogenase